MKKLVLATFCLILLGMFNIQQSYGQAAIDCQFTIDENNCDQYCVSIEIGSQDEPIFIGSSSVRFSYDPTVLSFFGSNQSGVTTGSYESINFDFNDGTDPSDPPDEECTYVAGGNTISPYSEHGFDGTINGIFLITWVLQLPTIFGTPAACPVIGPEWEEVAEICFEVLDPDGDPNLQFNGTANGPVTDLTGTNFNSDTDPPIKYENGTLSQLHTTFNEFCDGMTILGCTDDTACNYNAEATVDDGSCSNADPGTGNTDICTGDTEVWNSTTCSYDVDVVQVLGCTDLIACNFNVSANCDDGSCDSSDPMTGNIDICMGDTEIWNESTCSYDVDMVQVLGCTDLAACNFDVSANCDDGSCDSSDPMTGNTDICTGDTEVWNESTCSYDIDVAQVLGCTNETACNYDASANCDDGSCDSSDPLTGNTDICTGDTEIWNATTCSYDVDVVQILGCTDEAACNYDASANCDDSSCDSSDPMTGNTDICTGDTEIWNATTCSYDVDVVQVLGCTDIAANNYDASANCNEGCTYDIGCTDPMACNYDVTATVDDGSCSNADPMTGNTDICTGDTEVWNATTCSYDVDAVQVLGCTDETACNYNASANCDNGDCEYESCAVGTVTTTIFIDDNNNGLLEDTEETLQGVVVAIFNDDYSYVMMTGDDGIVFFDNVPIGVYQVEMVLPIGYRFGIGMTELGFSTNITAGANTIGGAEIGLGNDQNGIPAQVILPCENLVVLAEAICQNQLNNYQILLTFGGGNATGTGYMITDNSTGVTINTQQSFYIFGPYPAGTSYSYTVAIAANPDCFQTVSTAVVSCSVTAIELLHFKGETTDNGNVLIWTTASENEADYFTIEKSIDGNHFDAIGKVAAIGNSNTPQNYEYTDEDIQAGTTYYRLLETDTEGNTNIVSDVIALERTADFAITEAFPIPTTDLINVSFQTPTNSEVSIHIYDITGRTIATQTTEATVGENTATLDINNYPTGTYFLQISNGNKKATIRIVKN